MSVSTMNQMRNISGINSSEENRGLIEVEAGAVAEARAVAKAEAGEKGGRELVFRYLHNDHVVTQTSWLC